MIVLSHRGLWKSEKEKNTNIAFSRSFDLGFGTETDVRDYCGELVISHDIANSNCMPIADFLQLYSSYSTNLPLALNIKADGLQNKLLLELNNYRIANCFVFDMSVPDMYSYVKTGLNVFTRQSEFEPAPVLYESVQGVWIDCFKSDWVGEAELEEHLSCGKQVCLVSPDLHGRQYVPFWEKLAKMKIINNKNLMLCTDNPEEARKVFNE